MSPLGTLIIYAAVGVVVGTAMLLRQREGERRLFACATAVVFWPLYAPFLLASSPAPATAPAVATDLDGRIDAAEKRLLAALGKLEGAAEHVLAPELARVRGLAASLHKMSSRLREMDELLKSPELDPRAAKAALDALLAEGRREEEPRVQSVRSRLKSGERLAAMRDRLCDDVERALLKMEEMSAQTLLLKFAGRPDEEALRLVKDIAASVEEVTEGLLATA